MSKYSNEELAAVYELGRLYFEMGYFAPAERIFSGLTAVDERMAVARLGLGLVKLELGLFQEAAAQFRQALQLGFYDLQAKLGLCAAFIALGEIPRSASILAEIAKGVEGVSEIDPEIRRLIEAFVVRCKEG